MRTIQEKESTLINNLSGTEIGNQLDSRLRDLEKNIAVAREFIKLADESYSELRHKWNLLHEEVGNKSETNSTGRAIVVDEKRETRPRNKKPFKTRETEVTELNKPVSPSFTDISEKPEGHPRRVKTTNRPKKEPETSGKDADSIPSEKPSQPYRDPGRRRGRTSGRN